MARGTTTRDVRGDVVSSRDRVTAVRGDSRAGAGFRESRRGEPRPAYCCWEAGGDVARELAGAVDDQRVEACAPRRAAGEAVFPKRPSDRLRCVGTARRRSLAPDRGAVRGRVAEAEGRDRGAARVQPLGIGRGEGQRSGPLDETGEGNFATEPWHDATSGAWPVNRNQDTAGMRTVKRAPPPGASSRKMRPPWASTMALTRLRPRPRPRWERLLSPR